MARADVLPSLALLVSKQVDIVLDRGGAQPGESKFILSLYDVIQKAMVSKPWVRIRSNSVTISAAFGLSQYPPDAFYDPVAVAGLLWPSTHVLAFWGGGPNFQQVLEAATRMRRKRQFYLCDCKGLTLEKINLTKE